MVKFISLSSGSNGNCYYLGNDRTSLLIDVGIGGRTIKKRLAEHDISVDTIDMVLVTHDHVDHIKYLGSFTERFQKPVFTTEKLHRSLTFHFCTKGHMGGCVKNTKPGEMTEYNGVKFSPFFVPHDATETVGYFIDFFGEKFTFITDLGEVTDDVVKYARLADHLIIESNYDVDMLIMGSYSPELKLRIMKGHGHLSNEQTAGLLKRAYHKELKSIYLCHLSENNNTPDLALKSAESALLSIGVRPGNDVMLYCLPRGMSSMKFSF
ncbi:MAG: MBL fold metallo-hydrolase [Bacteroidales bacterium]|nr:MBL fold metallo-hydrolase [Bacteroidales bacterium]